MTQWVYKFGSGAADGDSSMVALLGGKGANLAEMCNLGLPVPPGFTISTEVCSFFYDNGRSYPGDLESQVNGAIAVFGGQVSKNFGDPDNPLLVSVRSGARASMPGMMDTVLNLGLNDATVEGLSKLSGDTRFAYDSYRRFIQMYSDVVLGVEHYCFEEILEIYKEEREYFLDTDLSADDWRRIVDLYKHKVADESGAPFPQDVSEQLWGAIGAVFGSWRNTRAQTYRRLHNIPDEWGTAVNIQAMVFGNMGDDSATGVAFTRNPSTGENAVYGEYLINAQGEDVVAGIRTPQPLSKAARESTRANDPSMEERLPALYKKLTAVFMQLEAHYKDMQDIEFTVEKGGLWMLQTRSGKRTTEAALKIAVDLANEGVIERGEAIGRIDPEALDQLLHPTLDPDAEREIITSGLPASPGAASGAVVFHPDEAERRSALGENVILVRIETSPEDIHGMHAAVGILTARGGMTSHAAVVARGMGRPCVSGAGSLKINYANGEFSCSGLTISEGDVITVDGSSGQVILGQVPTLQPKLSGDFATLMSWADGSRRMTVRANAETPKDAQVARDFGAEGIGLCRTEHMFFDTDRILSVREMILADDEMGRRAALDKILPMQRKDFEELFVIMSGLPVTIRLLDPPLHEFLPHTEEEIQSFSSASGMDVGRLRSRVNDLHEFNPMLGHRGCRLGVSFPEIYEMQARAIFEAAIDCEQNSGDVITPEIMVPLVALRRELDEIKLRIDAVARTVMEERGASLNYLVGTMIELPRAALRSGEIAESAEFFSFGTNDLTQTTFGISRDDSARFLNDYLERNVIQRDPFVSIDVEGVGELVSIAVERGRATRPNLKLGICGEHGGDPDSIHFCEKTGLDYVSCSPYRVPIARLAAAQAALKSK
jgi:pyruvate,orthophosphate dikinase